MRTKSLVFAASAALVVSGQVWVVTSAQAVAEATLTPVRASIYDDVPFAAASWTSGSPLTGSERVWVDVTTAPSATAQLFLVDGDKVGSVGLPTNAVTLNSPETGTLNPGSGTTGRVGLRADTSGTYAGVLGVVASDGTQLETVNFQFTTRGRPVSLEVTASTTSALVNAPVTSTVRLLDASGSVTQPVFVDLVRVSSATSSFDAYTLAMSGDPASTLSDGETQVTWTSATQGSADFTVTPMGTLPAWGSRPASVQVNFIAPNATSTPTPTPTPSPAPTPTPTTTPSP